MKTSLQSILIVITLVFCGLLQQTQAISPAPDGCYPSYTTAEGCNALNSLTAGAGNTGVGWYSLFLDTTGSFNTGIGGGALALNTADSNTAVGAAALLLNTTGTENVAVGTDALVFNDAGGRNTAVGTFALFNSMGVGFNTAVGDRTLFNNTTGDQNTAVGTSAFGGGPALFNNTTGRFNTAVGGAALSTNTIGGDNTGVGAGALNDNMEGNENTAVGLNALMRNTGSNNVALGSNAGSQATTGSDNVYIGYNIQGSAGESNTCYIKSIFGQTAAGGSAVFIDANSKLGTLTSSRRFKEDIQHMGTASEALFGLEPVKFHYKKNIDPAGRSQFGLVAEEVAKVNPDLVVLDKDGKPYSVRYDQVNAMLLNEFLKEHKAFVEGQQKIEQEQKEIDALKAELREQRALIQNVSEKAELTRSRSRVVAND
jgi:trimeric autotransporter adhesin